MSIQKSFVCKLLTLILLMWLLSTLQETLPLWAATPLTTARLTELALAAPNRALGESPVNAVTAAAVTVTVDTTADAADKVACQDAIPADCPLRGAIQRANQNSGDQFTIHVPTGVYTLTAAGAEEDDNLTGDLDIKTTSALVIRGDENGDTVVQGDLTLESDGDRIFDIEAGAKVTIQKLIIRHGYGDSGGGLTNRGALTLIDTLVTKNSASEAAGLYNEVDATMTISRSIISDNIATDDAGALSNEGELSIMNSTLFSNTAATSGGINNTGELTIINSAIVANRADDYGGGITNNGVLAITNSTISGNQATGDDPDASGGGAVDQFDDAATLTINYSTIANNTAIQTQRSGLWIEAGEVSLRNTIIANNGDSNNFVLTPGSVFTSLGNNLSNQWNGMAIQSSDLTADPRLGPLANNGGSTLSHVLLTGSVAIDAGHSATCPATDQRGVLRPQGTGCDIGALENAPVADLLLRVTSTPAVALFGTPITYTLTISNAGPDVAANLRLTDTLPVSATLSATSTGCQPVAQTSPPVVVCSLSNLAPNGVAAVTLTVQPTAVGLLKNSGQVVSSLLDPTPLNNQSQVQTLVVQRPDTLLLSHPLTVTKSSTIEFTFSGVDGGAGIAGFECALDNDTFSSCTSPQIYSNLANGQHHFQVRAYDSAGYRDLTPATYTTTIAQEPDTRLLSQPPTVSQSSTSAFTFNGVDGGAGIAGFECALDNGAFSSCASPKIYTNLVAGQHSFQVRAYDSVGMRDLTPATYPWTIDLSTPLPDGDVTPAEGGVLITADQSITLTFPVGAVDAAINVTITQMSAPLQPTGNLLFANNAFTIIARDLANNPVTTFDQPFTLVVTYQDSAWQNAGIANESALNLYFWNGSAWQAILPCADCSLDTNANRITVQLDHLTEFALLGPATTQPPPTIAVYLPLINK
jgi:uncharacterized repeat protein (TIGR01451 family)